MDRSFWRAPWLLALAAAAFVFLGGAATARASEPAGGPALKQARVAWQKRSYNMAEPLYREALEKGGLAPDEVLEGYVRLGAIRTIRGRKEQALAAFRAAAVLDAKFVLPREALPKGRALADRAKRETAAYGSLQLSMTAPKETAANKTFKITASVDKAHVGAIVKKVSVLAKDENSGREATVEADAGESVEIEIPENVTQPNGTIAVRVDALDNNKNRLASVEERVKVVADEQPAAPPAVAAGDPSPSKQSAPKAAVSEIPSKTYDSNNDKKKGGFWSSPWPYIFGTVALAGAGAAVYFGTRPPDDVNVGQVGVRTL